MMEFGHEGGERSNVECESDMRCTRGVRGVDARTQKGEVGSARVLRVRTGGVG